MIKSIAALTSCFFVCTSHVQAVSLIVPAAAETAMGNNGIQTAFYFASGAQSFYGSNLFSGPVRITGFSIRMMEGSAIDGNTGVQNFQVYVSTTGKTATTLDTVDPSTNHGADKALVRDSPLTIFALGNLNGDGVTDWSTPINFDTPFVYDPADGNLLMEFGGTMPNGTFTTRFVDGWEVDGAGLARVSPLSRGGFISDQLGTVVRFDTEPVPEPSSAAFLGLVAALGLLRRKRS